MRRGVNSERRKYRPEYSAIGIITRLCVLQFLGTNLRVKLLKQKVFFSYLDDFCIFETFQSFSMVLFDIEGLKYEIGYLTVTQRADHFGT